MALCCLFGFLETLRDICWLLKLGLEVTVCVSVLTVCGHCYRNESGFSSTFIFFPCSFVYFILFLLLSGGKKKPHKKTKYLFFSLCIQLVTEHAFEIPDNIRPGHLIKELSKVIRSVEVRTESMLRKPSANKSLNQETPSLLCFWLTIFTF